MEHDDDSAHVVATILGKALLDELFAQKARAAFAELAAVARHRGDDHLEVDEGPRETTVPLRCRCSLWMGNYCTRGLRGRLHVDFNFGRDYG